MISFTEPRILISLDPPRISVSDAHHNRSEPSLSRELTDAGLRSLLVNAHFVSERQAKSLREFVVYTPIRNSELFTFLQQAGIMCTTNSPDCSCDDDGLVDAFGLCTDKTEGCLCACAETECA